MVFIPYSQQVRWVAEFFEGVMQSLNREYEVAGIQWKGQEEERESEGSEGKGGTGYWDEPTGRGPRGQVVDPNQEEEVFGDQLYFPTERRPIHYRRPVPLRSCPTEDQEKWFEESGIKIGLTLTLEERHQAIQLIYSWKDIFVDRIEDLPATDLVVYTIPTYAHARPHRAKDPIYARDEIR
ncbi:hypothetical protein L211DRAFT_847166 [Terfezia boudieri ATCC MYA-4762]|uniref:Uncharacterized protein n=1 Tax=Terfezia boudieri ATCC MYA-4762 TaxID=1051890 RepID=A0A3N4M9Y8_9PEZI|nr:hypothetical protein L211DRAFT_847166 [Terfezia boudieri ATCC MYA-4762]